MTWNPFSSAPNFRKLAFGWLLLLMDGYCVSASSVFFCFRFVFWLSPPRLPATAAAAPSILPVRLARRF